MAENTNVIVTEDKQLRAVVDDGTKAIPIENKFGKHICTVYLRPGDISIADRYDDVLKALPDLVKPLEEVSIKNDGTAKFEEEWEKIKEVETALYKQLNYLFDMDEAQDIFAKRNPFSAVNGQFFCEIIIELLGDLITETVAEGAEEMQRRTQKYLADLQPVITEAESNAGESAADA